MLTLCMIFTSSKSFGTVYAVPNRSSMWGNAHQKCKKTYRNAFVRSLSLIVCTDRMLTLFLQKENRPKHGAVRLSERRRCRDTRPGWERKCRRCQNWRGRKAVSSSPCSKFAAEAQERRGRRWILNAETIGEIGIFLKHLNRSLPFILLSWNVRATLDTFCCLIMYL